MKQYPCHSMHAREKTSCSSKENLPINLAQRMPSDEMKIPSPQVGRRGFPKVGFGVYRLVLHSRIYSEPWNVRSVSVKKRAAEPRAFHCIRCSDPSCKQDRGGVVVWKCPLLFSTACEILSGWDWHGIEVVASMEVRNFHLSRGRVAPAKSNLPSLRFRSRRRSLRIFW